MVLVVVFEEAGATGSLEPESKSRLLVSGFTLFGGVSPSLSSTTTMNISALTLDVPAAFCADISVEFGSAYWTKLVVCCAHGFVHHLGVE